MRGSVVKRGNGYSVVVELDRDPITGKRRQKWVSGYRTKRDAIGRSARLSPRCTPAVIWSRPSRRSANSLASGL
jgi:hypothetical protein